MIMPFAVALLAALQTPYQRHHCNDPQTQMDMNACAALDFERADDELNAEYRRAIEHARATDRDPLSRPPEGDDRPGEEASLREAQRAWVTFRDAHCRLEGYSARGGSMEPMLIDGCRIALTRERLRQLAGPAGPDAAPEAEPAPEPAPGQ